MKPDAIEVFGAVLAIIIVACLFMALGYIFVEVTLPRMGY